jgi:LytS/YehU family sensor histidine kinase
MLTFALAFACATLIIIVSAWQSHLWDSMMRDKTRPVLKLFLWPSIWWYSWALLAPFVVGMVERFPISKTTWVRHGLIQLGSFLLCFGVHVGIQVTAMLLPNYRDIHPDFINALTHHTITSIDFDLFIFCTLVAIAHAMIFYRTLKQREMSTVRLESELARAKLQVLKNKLNPHFLFNTLHSISTLMYRDVRAADRMLTRLSDLLRMTMERSDRHDIPLHEEIAFLEKYLQIEQIRFEDRLTFSFQIEPNLEQAMIPHFLLQPLVENAVKHGIAPTSRPGMIEVKAWATRDRLRVRVSDNGPGMATLGNGSHKGIGLPNVSARLEHRYESDYTLEFKTGNPTGLVVELNLPLQFEEDSVALHMPV